MIAISKPEHTNKGENWMGGNDYPKYRVLVVDTERAIGAIFHVEKHWLHEYSNGYSEWDGRTWRHYWRIWFTPPSGHSVICADGYSTRRDALEEIPRSFKYKYPKPTKADIHILK